MSVILVGAGGHAKALVETLTARGIKLDAYVDLRPCRWLPEVRRIESDQALDTESCGNFIVGFGGVTPDELRRRLDLFRRHQLRGWRAPAVVHPTAWVSETAKIGGGTVVLAGAIVQPGAMIGEASIINTGAIVEHDSYVGDGTHVAPRAMLLGDVRIGECAMVGAGAVVLQGAELPDGGFVHSLERYPR